MASVIRVLYVDDEPSLLDIGKLFLEKSGDFLVITLDSAYAALEYLKLEKIDAIISDYQMPGMDGLELLKKIRATGNTIPFIIFTGRGREEVVIEAINNGVDFYLQKGGDPKSQFIELEHKIRQAIARRQAELLLIESEKRLADIINFLPDATFAIDVTGHVIAWNRSIEVMTGVAAAKMLGKGDYEYAIPFYGYRRPILIDLISSSEVEIITNYKNITREKNILIAETSLPRPQGKPLILLGQASPLYNAGGDIVGAIESIRDITELRRSEEELRAANEQLIASGEELKSQYEELERDEQKIRESESRLKFILGFYEMPKQSESELMSFAVEGAGAVTGSPLGYLAFLNDDETELTMYAWSQNSMKECSMRDKPVIYPVVKTGLWGEAVRQRQPVITNDYQLPNPKKKGYPKGHPHIIRHMNIPVMDGDHIVLVAGVANKSTDYSDNDVNELSLLMQGLWQVLKRRRSEEELHEKNEELEQYFTTTLDLFCIADMNGHFLRLNQEWENTLGYPLSELVGHKFLDFVHPDDLNATLTALADLGNQREVLNFTNRYRHKDGSYRLIEWRSIPKDNKIYAAARDITRHYLEKHYSAALSRLKQKLLISAPLEEKLKKITDTCVILFGADFARIWITGPGDLCEAGCIHAAGTEGLNVCRNRSNCLHLIVSSGRYTHTDGTHRRVPFGAYKIGLIGNGENARFITNDVTHDPRVHDHVWAASLGLVSFSGFQLISSDGKPIGVLAFFSRQVVTPEMTKYVEDLASTTSHVILAATAEDALRQSEERFRRLLSRSFDAVVIHRDGRIVLVNNAAAQIMGASGPSELIGKPVIDLVHPDYRGKVEERTQQILQSSQVTVPLIEEKFLRLDGTPITVEVMATTTSHNGKRAIMVVFRDITDHMQAEEALREANKKLNLLSSVTRHDIVNKVSIQLGLLALAQEQVKDNPEMAAFIGKLESAAQAIREQIEFTRIYQDLGSHEPQWQDLHRALAKNPVPPHLSISDDCAGVEIFADVMLEKVFGNLIENAIRHGGNLTKISMTAGEADGSLVIRFVDNGKGVPNDEKERIFELGYGKNTGFGLFLVREVLAITGITIIETGEKGEGARFEITVPKGVWRYQYVN